jgi:Antitoxin component of bacterial toxin-antitoxin system, MqsA
MLRSIKFRESARTDLRGVWMVKSKSPMGYEWSRYERGDIEPSTATIQFLRLLDKHPELIKELRMAA